MHSSQFLHVPSYMAHFYLISSFIKIAQNKHFMQYGGTVFKVENYSGISWHSAERYVCSLDILTPPIMTMTLNKEDMHGPVNKGVP